MFIGHYGASLAAKRWAPHLSLGWLFIAVQLLDLLFSGFLLLGVEKMRIVPGFTASNAYDLYSMPYSHGLAAALAWSALAGLVARALLGRGGGAAALAFGLCVFSHWLLDLPMHTPDMPLLGDGSPHLGFGLWHHRGLSIAVELVALAAGALLWLRGGVRSRPAALAFLAALAVVAVATPFLPQPSSVQAFAFSAPAAYVVLAGAAAWVDRS
jgi:hypothetical protein